MLLACSRHIPAALQTTKIIWGQGNDPQGNREKVLYFQEGTFQIYQRYCRRAASRLVYRNSIANGSHFTSFRVQGARDLASFAVSVCLFALKMYQFPFFFTSVLPTIQSATSRPRRRRKTSLLADALSGRNGGGQRHLSRGGGSERTTDEKHIDWAWWSVGSLFRRGDSRFSLVASTVATRGALSSPSRGLKVRSCRLTPQSKASVVDGGGCRGVVAPVVCSDCQDVVCFCRDVVVCCPSRRPHRHRRLPRAPRKTPVKKQTRPHPRGLLEHTLSVVS